MADNKKIYTIQINGIDQSIKQVDALSDALQFLDKKIKELESRNVSVTSSSNGAGGNRAAELQTEDKLLKQIQSTEQQIRDARREDYQSLLAQKDILKETKEIQEERAAAERLLSGGYGNTMKGLKQELSDIKKVMQTTDLGSDKFQELTKRANEIINKLKELDVAYGQFGRNVGNYPSTVGEGFSKLQIEVNGVTREFDNAKQAMVELRKEMQTLSVKQDLGIISEEEAERLKSLIPTFKELESSVKDAGKPMDGLMDTMQGLVSIASTAQGIGALFGFDDNAIEQSIQKLVALQNVLQGLQTLQTQMDTNEGIGKWLTKGNAAIDKLVTSIFGIETASKAATVASKALGVALKTLGIGAIIAGVTTLINLLETWSEKQKKAAEKIEEAAEKVRKSVEEQRQAYVNASAQFGNTASRLSHLRTEFLTTNDALKKTSILKEATKEFKNLGISVKSVTDAQSILVNKGDKVIEMIRLQGEAAALASLRIDAFKKSFNMLLENGYDVNSASILAGNSGLVTAFDKRLDEVNQKINSFQNELGIKTKETGSKVSKTVKDVEADIAKARVDAMKQGWTKTLAQLELERNKRIAEAKKTGKLVNEQIEQINNTYNQKIFDARVAYHENLIKDEKSYWSSIQSIRQQAYNSQVEYARKMNELRLENSISASTNFNNQFEVNALTIDYNSSDVKKYLGKYKQDIVEVYINTKNTIEFIEKALNGLGDKYENLPQEAKQLYDKYNGILLEAKSQLDDIENQNRGIGKFIEENIRITSESMNEAYALRSLWRKQYYEKILEYTKESADKELKIEKDKLDTELKMEQDAEKERHKIAISEVYDESTALGSDKTISSTPNTLLKKYEEEMQNSTIRAMKASDAAKYFEPYRIAMDEWLRDLDTKRKQDEISWDDYIQITGSTALKGYQQAKTDYEQFLTEYNKMSDSEKAKNEEKLQESLSLLNQEYVKYLEKVQGELVTHQNKMKVLESKYRQETLQADRDNLKARQSAATEYYSNLITENENALSSINSKVDKAEKRNPLGIINYSATKNELIDLKKTVELVLGDIANEKEQLLEKLKKGDISFGDYDTLISQLKTIETQAQESSQNIEKRLKELFANKMQSISNIVQQLGSSFNTLIGNIGDYTDTLYENEINDLQDFIDKYEKKLDEQEEITQKHASEVDSIEQELANARGDRRQHLIDQLNAEMAAQRASLAEQKKMEKEKKKIGEDKETLEKERFEQQKRVQTAQAAMSGALAVTNALSVNPIWLGIALAAMAAASAAAQIATIKAQKYANGGVIEGKSHAQGGVKVLGGQAEVEGGEYITNKVTTAKNVDLLEYINSKKKRINLEDLIEFYGVGSPVKKNIQTVRTKFADGGVVPTLRNDITINDRLLTAFEDYSNRPTVVSVVDIIDRTQTVNEVKTMAGLEV